MAEFGFDQSLYCRYILGSLCGVFPKHLESTYKKIREIAASGSQPPGAASAVRVYIFDNRLRPMFAAAFDEPEVPSQINDFVHETRSLEDRPYGTGDKIERRVNIYNDRNYNAFLKRFDRKYGFVPEDVTAMASFVMVRKDNALLHQLISYWQLAFVLNKFRSYNQIDWDETGNRFDSRLRQ
jgi:hypothetical protein